MICIEREHSDFEQLQSQLRLAMGVPVEPTISVIYNNLRYDDNTHIVTFHLREKDWDELKSTSRMWISSTADDLLILFNNLLQVINREPVPLGDEIVKSVQVVDPLETFGLFSVQNFTVNESSENCQVLKVLKVEENTFSYYAELEILDSVICKAKAMKITFHPEKCPTEVQIDFEDAKGDPLHMYFSCSVDVKSSKFQISNTRGSVLCHIPKREDGTVGELVIRNPGPVPFHALPLWDSKLDDLRVCGRMFCTKLDLKLKEQRKSGSPFFNLRETISMILRNHITEPETPMIQCVEERGIIEEPYQTPDDIVRKKGFIILVQNVYKWKNLPVAKVVFSDCQRYAAMLRNNPTDSRLLEAYFNRTVLHLVQRIPADQQEQSLFRKMLYTNAARVAQSGSDVWTDSFITLLFPRESTLDLFSDVQETAGERKFKTKGFPRNPLPSSETSSYSDEALPEDSFSECSADVIDPPQCTPPLGDPECAFCHSKTGTLKRCLGCKEVSYCNTKCQKRHWKKHKPDCQNSG
ncbi:uncharacterized protein LOC110050878 [Orbicella faveolata]|uniref:uncharacterized protein LOC110050878 n=1 Tax=Orbicella faveolata TaxID=48498 RepID=UPI0009E24276|nr:uncharacterized protein LOC110050878 [Orbicella faveolata]